VKIEDEFRVDVPIDEAWKVLLDVERIAPCMPGAQLQEIEGDEYRGIVKIKVGPITAQYKGAARIVETDENAHQVVLKAEGRDTRGQGNASATVTATLTPAGSGTVVHIDTDLNITGKVAQFGRGVMADVSSKLLGQFASNLERDVLSGNGTDVASSAGSASTTSSAGSASTGSASTTSSEPPTSDDPEPASDNSPTADAAPSAASSAESTPVGGARRIDSPEPKPVDLFDTAGNAVAKRVVPVIVVIVALLTLRSLRKRRQRKKQQRDS
jgi:carbon monoxide dehydrogenase subunit G